MYSARKHKKLTCCLFLTDAKGKEQNFTAVVNVKVGIKSCFDKFNSISEEFHISDHKTGSCFVTLLDSQFFFYHKIVQQIV